MTASNPSFIKNKLPYRETQIQDPRIIEDATFCDNSQVKVSANVT